MIISYKHKFIFIKTNKTAGTSIEIALSRFCGADDIITPISLEDEKIRRDLGYPGPQNYLAPIWAYGVRDMSNLLLKKGHKRKYRFYNHNPAGRVRKRIGEEVWNGSYKFCFERNPWDRVISLYYYRNASGSRRTISEFIESDAPLVLKRKGFELYTINGEIAVDKVCRFENISEELEAIRTRLGIPGKLVLPRAKSTFRNDKRSYRDILNVKQRTRIAELFADEINLFGYEF